MSNNLKVVFNKETQQFEEIEFTEVEKIQNAKNSKIIKESYACKDFDNSVIDDLG